MLGLKIGCFGFSLVRGTCTQGVSLGSAWDRFLWTFVGLESVLPLGGSATLAASATTALAVAVAVVDTAAVVDMVVASVLPRSLTPVLVVL